MKTLTKSHDKPEPITYMQAKYLKHVATTVDPLLRVHVHIYDKHPYIYVGKYPYATFQGALTAMQVIAASIVSKKHED